MEESQAASTKTEKGSEGRKDLVSEAEKVKKAVLNDVSSWCERVVDANTREV